MKNPVLVLKSISRDIWLLILVVRTSSDIRLLILVVGTSCDIRFLVQHLERIGRDIGILYLIVERISHVRLLFMEWSCIWCFFYWPSGIIAGGIIVPKFQVKVVDGLDMDVKIFSVSKPQLTLKYWTSVGTRIWTMLGW